MAVFFLPQVAIAARQTEDLTPPSLLIRNSTLSWADVRVGHKKLAMIEPRGSIGIRRYGVSVNETDREIATIAVLSRDRLGKEYQGIVMALVPKVSLDKAVLVWDIESSNIMSPVNLRTAQVIVTQGIQFDSVEWLDYPDEWWKEIGGFYVFNAGPKALSMLFLASPEETEGKAAANMVSILEEERLIPGKFVRVTAEKMENFVRVIARVRTAMVLGMFEEESKFIVVPQQVPNSNYVKVLVFLSDDKKPQNLSGASVSL